jgi:hypothetical protein
MTEQGGVGAEGGPPVEELAGRYRLLGLLGRGGMGEVWSASDAVLRREVAVKLLPALSGAESERRFQREAATLAGLRHPGITVVHDAGRHGGFLFLVMELLDGADLGKLVAGHRGGLPLERALDLAAQTAEAVGAAHDKGVVHRDLKPANVFVQAGDRVKVCDFGIARSADATSALTATGHIVGTPPYMSPEQCRGGEVDARSDLYSFGCALFEMLTGATPFPAEQSVYALLHQHVSEPPPRLAEVRPDLPAALDALVGALLAKEPGARPASAARVAEELAALGGRSALGPTRVDVPTAVEPDTGVEAVLRIARLIREPAGRVRAMYLVAEALDGEPARARRLMEELDGVVATLPADQPGKLAVALALAGRRWARLDPARALVQLERAVGGIAHMEGDEAYWYALEIAEGAAAVTAARPAEAARLMADLGRTVVALDVEVSHPQFLAARLAEIAVAGRTADPAAAQRLLRTAERTAEDADPQDTALEFLAPAMALADLGWALLIVGRIADTNDRVCAWGKVIEAVGEHRPDLLDEVLDACGLDRPAMPAAPPPTPEPAVRPAPPARGLRRFLGLEEPQSAAPAPLPPAAPTEEDGPFSLMYVAEAAAPYAAAWAERVAARITSPRYRVEAFLRMARAVAGKQSGRAERWLRRAYEAARDAGKADPGQLGDIAAAATTAAPDLAKEVAAEVARLDGGVLAGQQVSSLAWLAGNIAALDPHTALRLAGLAEQREEDAGDYARRCLAEAHAAAAAALARTNTALAEATVRRGARILSAVTDLEELSWIDWAPLARLAAKRPAAAVRIGACALEEVEAETRDRVLTSLARAFAPVDLPHAESLATSVVDPALRDEALGAIVEELLGERS